MFHAAAGFSVPRLSCIRMREYIQLGSPYDISKVMRPLDENYPLLNMAGKRGNLTHLISKKIKILLERLEISNKCTAFIADSDMATYRKPYVNTEGCVRQFVCGCGLVLCM